MSPDAGLMLLNEVVPLISGAIARGAVKPFGCEDVEELQSEGCALAASILDSAEMRGKPVSAGNIAFYALQALKSGRRSCSAGRSDVLSPAAQADGRVVVMSMDASICDAENEGDQDLTLHDALAASQEDGASAAGRRIDWDAVMQRIDERKRKVIALTAEGMNTQDIADSTQVSSPRICQLRVSVGPAILNAWGSNGIAECSKVPAWASGVHAERERRAARYSRRW